MTELTAYLTSIGAIVEALVGMFSSVLQFILANPILAVPTGISVLVLIVNTVRSFIYGQR